MRPLDFRLATFADLQERLQGQRAAVFAAWKKYGPCTTQQLAASSGLSILSLRPRTTELFQLGFICLADEQPAWAAGVYRAREYPELVTWFDAQCEAATPHQAELAFR
jgi:hypothetical protein